MELETLGELPGYVVRDGLIECRADGGLLRVVGKIGGLPVTLTCDKCQADYKLGEPELDRLTHFLENQRRLTMPMDKGPM